MGLSQEVRKGKHNDCNAHGSLRNKLLSLPGIRKGLEDQKKYHGAVP
jgi:hypothetical protein